MKRDPLDDLDRDIRHHIESETQDNIARGMAPQDARSAALRRFGNISQIKEDTRAVWTWTWLESLAQDVRYATRSFFRAPAFALTVIGTIGLALGLNTTLFTIFNAYVLRPFAVHDPYSLYRVNWSTKNEAFHPFTPKEYDDFRRVDSVFADTIATSLLMTRAAGQQWVGEQVSGNYFQMLSVQTELGRPLLPGDTNALVLSDAAWKNKFGSAPDIVGSKLSMLGSFYEVVGVLRPEFSGTSQMVADIWIPLITAGPEAAVRVTVICRLKPDVSLKQTQASLMVWARQETADRPDNQHATGVKLESAATSIHLTAEILAVFAPILIAFGLVLVIACSNVANMMLARAMARQREIGVRLSLGAGRLRLVRQLLTESLLLALPAALVGLLVSQVAIRFTERLMFATAPPVWLQLIHFFSLETDFRVFLFILAAAVASTLFFGLAPAIQATRPGISYAARGDFSADVRPARLRNALVIGQVTVCVLLLICSGVLLRAGRKMQESDVGLVPENVLDVRFLRGKFDAKIPERLKREPGVETVATAWRAPLYGAFRWIPIATSASPDFVRVGYDFVSPEYFVALRIPMVRGRNFTDEESRSEAAVAIVSEKTAARFWPGEDPLGRTIRIKPDPDPRADGWKKTPGYGTAVIVGIARDVMSGGPIDGIDPTCFYFPTGPQGAKNESLLVRVSSQTDAMHRALDAAIASVSNDSATYIVPMDQALALQVYPFRASSWIASFLGGLALVLTLSGIYGVLSYLVSQRTKEIGIRMALGASTANVIRLVLAQSMKLAVVGIALGVVFALGVSRVFSSELAAINTFDLIAYGGGIVAALAAALAAAYFPSKRAAGVDPISAIRCD